MRWAESLGDRFDSADRSIVIPGDTCVAEVRRAFSGRIVVGHDLDVY